MHTGNGHPGLGQWVQPRGNPGAFSNPVCANAGDELVGVWWTYQNFPNQTQLCASMVETISSWSDLIPAMPGEPCETVHS